MSKTKEHLMSLQDDISNLVSRETEKKEVRPWGYYVVLDDKETHKVKRIVVNPDQRLSYQSHEKRSEAWLFVEGEGIVTINEVDHLVMPKSLIRIPAKFKHRVKNTGKTNLVFIEIQTGEYFGEDDIVRYDDDYGRTK